MRGYLVSFDGNDASGKSTLLPLVGDALEAKGYKTRAVEEFSNSELGTYLRTLLTKDKFLRFGKKTAFTGTMYVIADLYYQDEQEIKPALEEGRIVLKDRHIDSLFACQIPKIKEEYPELENDKLYEWIRQTSRNLYVPDLTFLLTVPLSVQIERVKGRGELISEEDLSVFDEREKIYKHLSKDNSRIIVFENNKLVDGAVDEITEFIIKFVEKRELRV